MPLDFNIMVGGEAGQGIQTMGAVLAKAMSRGGLHVFSDQDYESRIRGGHSFFRVRVKDTEVLALSEKVDILLAMNKETIDLHKAELKGGDSRIIYDGSVVKTETKDGRFLDIPLAKLAEETAKSRLMSNSVAVGAALGLVDYDFELLAGVLREQFAKGGVQMQEANVKAARAGYDYARQNGRRNTMQSIKPQGKGNRILLDGNEALALGAMCAGVKFVAGYPMTPTTSILEYIASKGRQYNIVVIQPEDEIAAVNMVVGAAYAGVRAMTATSGGGFCLMVEGLSLAGMTETSIVVVLGQRPGPAIGLPTRTEQGELQFALHAGHGEFPRAVLAPATVTDAFYLTTRAFNLAERYQTPVIVITDNLLANSYNDVDRFDLSQVKIDRGALLSDEEASQLTEYKRHLVTESGISPRAIPGQGRVLVVTDSDEHNEEGHIIEDAGTRNRMVSKRMCKLDGLRKEIGAPRFEKMPDAEITLIGWGSTYGAIKEAAEILQKDGVAANVLHFSELWPFPVEVVSPLLKASKKTFVIENNYTGQLAHLISSETGFRVDRVISRYDGRPFSPQSIVNELKREVA